MSNDTGLIKNLQALYDAYGGVGSFVLSGYTWVSIAITALSWKNIKSERWPEITLDVIPTLAGFSIAAYAIFFAVLSESDRQALSKPDKRLDGRSPFIILISSISHAVLVQILSILIAIIYASKSIPIMSGWEERSMRLNYILSTIGWFLTLYGIVLISASIFSIFRIVEIKSRV